MSPPSPRKASTSRKPKSGGKRKRTKAKKVEVEVEQMEEMEDSSPSVASSSDPTPTKDIPFEELYHNRATQHAAWAMLQETAKKGAKANSTAHEELREERKEPKRKLRARRGAGKVEEASSAAGADEEQVDQEEPAGQALLQDLIHRYDRNKKKAKPKKKGGRSSQLVLSDCDVDEDIIQEDFLAALEGTSDFLKYSVPQYELKEKLYQMHYSVIENLDPKEIPRLFNDVLPALRQIKNDELPCQRHEIFKRTGLSKQSLRDMTVSEPFNSGQEHRVTKLIEDKIFGAGTDLIGHQGELVHYITSVMIPEALVRIFAKANNIDVELADKELRFKAAYDGELPPEVIETLPPDIE